MMTSTHHPIETSRRKASEALEKANEAMNDWRSGMQDIASRSLDNGSTTAQAARQRLDQYTQSSTRYVAENPLKSALIAAAIGAAVASLVVALRRQREHADRA